MDITNAGSVRLTNIHVPGQDSCNVTLPLLPSATASCIVQWLVQQGDFDKWDANYAKMASGLLERSLAVVATNMAADTKAEAVTTVRVPLASQPNLTVTYTDVIRANRSQCSGQYMPGPYTPGCSSYMGPSYPGQQTSPFAVIPGKCSQHELWKHQARPLRA